MDHQSAVASSESFSTNGLKHDTVYIEVWVSRPVRNLLFQDASADAALGLEVELYAYVRRDLIPLSWISPKQPRLFQCNSPVLAFPSSCAYLGATKVGRKKAVIVEKLTTQLFSLTLITSDVKLQAVKELCLRHQKSDYDHGNVAASNWDSPVGLQDDSGPGRRFKWNTVGNGSPPTISKHIEPEVHEEVVAKDPDTLFDELKQSYYNTLFLSKGSLAYFPKTTLSRYKSQMNPHWCGSGAQNSRGRTKDQLLAFSIEASGVLERLKDVVRGQKGLKSMYEHAYFDGKQTQEQKVAKEWLDQSRSSDQSSLSGTSLKELEELKIRSAQLQLIVLLEISCLQKEQAADDSAPVKVKLEKESPTPSTGNVEDRIDSLVDKLCIWQTLTGDLFGSGNDNTAEEKDDNDFLKQFCSEVIVPFFSRRIPRTVNSIKMRSGLVTTSQPKKKKTPALPKTKSGHIRASVAEDKNGKSGLQRSISAPVMSKSQQLAPSSTKNKAEHQFQRFQNMQVDLKRSLDSNHASSNQSQAKEDPRQSAKHRKAIKEKEIEEELRQAIRGIAKPNRNLAFPAAGEPKVPLKPENKRKRGPAIQINATPSKRSLSTSAMARKGDSAALENEFSPVVSSRKRLANDKVFQKLEQASHAHFVEATPVKKAVSVQSGPPQSLARWQSTPVLSERSTDAALVPDSDDEVNGSPREPLDVAPDSSPIGSPSRNPPRHPVETGKTEGDVDNPNDELYRALGWDDEA